MSSLFSPTLPGDAQLLGARCGPLDTNAYLLRSGQEAIIIDPAIDSGALLDAMREWNRQGVTLRAIWNTHGHFDHVYDNARWLSAFPVPLLAHRADEEFLEHLREQSLWFGLSAPDVAVPDTWLAPDQNLQVGALTARVRHLPGHSPGSVAFDFGACVFGGDVLFQGSVGRTDLPGSSASELADSLRTLWKLPDETRVFPGHGAPTTIGAEKRSNLVARELLSRFRR